MVQRYVTTPVTKDVNDLLVHSGKALQQLGAENTKLSELNIQARRLAREQARQLDFWKVSSQLVAAGIIPPNQQPKWVKEASAREFPPDYYLEKMRQREMNPFDTGSPRRVESKTSAPVTSTTPPKTDDPYEAARQAKLARLERFHQALT